MTQRMLPECYIYLHKLLSIQYNGWRYTQACTSMCCCAHLFFVSRIAQIEVKSVAAANRILPRCYSTPYTHSQQTKIKRRTSMFFFFALITKSITFLPGKTSSTQQSSCLCQFQYIKMCPMQSLVLSSTLQQGMFGSPTVPYNELLIIIVLVYP